MTRPSSKSRSASWRHYVNGRSFVLRASPRCKKCRRDWRSSTRHCNLSSNWVSRSSRVTRPSAATASRGSRRWSPRRTSAPRPHAPRESSSISTDLKTTPTCRPPTSSRSSARCSTRTRCSWVISPVRQSSREPVGCCSAPTSSWTSSSRWRDGARALSVTWPVKMTPCDSWCSRSFGRVRSTRPRRPVVDTTNSGTQSPCATWWARQTS